MSPKAASKTTGTSRKSKGIVATQLVDAAKTKRAKLADSSYRFLRGGMTSLGGKTHRRLVSSSSCRVALMVLVAVCRAEGLSWSNLKQLDNVGVLYLNHFFLQREGNTARNSFKAAHGQQFGEFFLVLANQPPVSQFLGIRPRDLKRGRSETLSSMQVDKYNLYQLQREDAPLNLLQKNQSLLEVKLRLRRSSDHLLAKCGMATRAQKEAGKVEPSVQALSNYMLQNIANVLHNPPSPQIVLVRSAASKTN